MDERQKQIREQAGLTESRLNQDFIDFLRKFSTPVLLLVTVAAFGYFGYQQYKKRAETKINAGFAELDSASRGEASPDALVAVADQHGSAASVSSLARLKAAESYLQSVLRGIKPGTSVSADGTLASPDDALSPEDRAAMLEKAKNLFDQVIADNADARFAPLRLNARWGLATIAECKADFDGAVVIYAVIQTESKAAGYEKQAELAKARADGMSVLRAAAPLVSKSELPVVPSAFVPGSDPVLPAMPEMPEMPTMPTLPGPQAPTGPQPVGIEPVAPPTTEAQPVTPPVTPPTTPPTTPPDATPANP